VHPRNPHAPAAAPSFLGRWGLAFPLMAHGSRERGARPLLGPSLHTAPWPAFIFGGSRAAVAAAPGALESLGSMLRGLRLRPGQRTYRHPQPQRPVQNLHVRHAQCSSAQAHACLHPPSSTAGCPQRGRHLPCACSAFGMASQPPTALCGPGRTRATPRPSHRAWPLPVTR
jgi:hypothetical protein